MSGPPLWGLGVVVGVEPGGEPVGVGCLAHCWALRDHTPSMPLAPEAGCVGGWWLWAGVLIVG